MAEEVTIHVDMDHDEGGVWESEHDVQVRRQLQAHMDAARQVCCQPKVSI